MIPAGLFEIRGLILAVLLLAGCSGTTLPADSDQDGLSDEEELFYSTDPEDADSDDDGIIDGEEIALGTDPNDSDTDSDGLMDGEERVFGTDPNAEDSDSDGVHDIHELANGTDPVDPDSDDDGLLDGEEAALGTDPNAADSDSDGVSDLAEGPNGTDPLDPDSDDDDLSDGDEGNIGTDPLDPDTDADGFPDGNEVSGGSDPLDPTSFVYTGGWPNNLDKDAVNVSSWDDPPVTGGPFVPYEGIDQYGDMVNILDFAFDGKPIVIAYFSTMMKSSNSASEMCEDFHQLLSSGEGADNPQSAFHENQLFLELIQGARELVLDEKIRWVSVFSEASPEDLASYHEAFPSEYIPLLSDGGGDSNDPSPFSTWLGSGGVATVPNIGVLNEELQYIFFTEKGYFPGLEFLMDLGL